MKPELEESIRHNNLVQETAINLVAIKPKKISAKNKILQYLISHNNQATNAELAELLRGQRGQLSWSQRVRDIRKELKAKGKDLTCKELRVGIYLYQIVEPKEQKEFAFA